MTSGRQSGMALGIVAMLLLGLALLGAAGFSAAIAALAVAGLEQHAARAFEAAEAGVSRTLRTWHGPDSAASTSGQPSWPWLWQDVTAARRVTTDPPHWQAAWPDGFSIGSGDGTFTTRVYTIDSEGRAPRGVAMRVEQSFTVVEPAP